MNYLQKLASEIRANVDSDDLPDQNTESLFLNYAALLLAKGRDVTAEDIHNAWAAWMTSKDPAHDALRPFKELSARTQQEDIPYLRAVQKTALQL